MKKIIITLLLALAMIFSIASCGSTTTDDVDETEKAEEVEETEEVKETEEKSEEVAEEAEVEVSDEDIYVPIVSVGYSHQFWQAVKSGADKAAEDYGIEVTFEGPEQETMVDKQVDMIKTALTKDPVAIAVAAIDIEAVRPVLEEATEKGIHVVGFDSGVGDLAVATAATNSIEAGGLAAENAGRLLDGKGKVGVIGHSQMMIDSIERVQGFVDKIEADFPEMEIVDIQYGEGDHLKSADIAKGMLQANPDISLIFASNEGSCVGAYNGLKEAGLLDQVTLVGFDSSAAMKEAIRNGEIAGAITQDPVRIGYLSIELAYKLYKGEEVEEYIDTGCHWYDASNMDDPVIAPLLYD